MNNPRNKTEKELFDEAMEKWPEELERLAEEIYKTDSILTEGVDSIEEYREYLKTCIPWEEYRKNWLI